MSKPLRGLAPLDDSCIRRSCSLGDSIAILAITSELIAPTLIGVKTSHNLAIILRSIT